MTTDQYAGTVEVVTFTVDEGNPGGVITVTVRDPAGAQTDYVAGTAPEISNPSAGVYVATIPCPTAGTWLARLVAAGGTFEGASEVEWRIAPTGFS